MNSDSKDRALCIAIPVHLQETSLFSKGKECRSGGIMDTGLGFIDDSPNHVQPVFDLPYPIIMPEPGWATQPGDYPVEIEVELTGSGLSGEYEVDFTMKVLLSRLG